MSIPTYNLYNFVAQALENKFLIKHFYPWGEKKFVNLINNEEDKIPNVIYKKIPVVLCHDQEPLHFDLYTDDNLKEQLSSMPEDIQTYYRDKKAKNLNLRWTHPNHRAETWILLHSEINSPEVEKYQNTGLFKCAYWWSHAIIARDWYRFAEYDNRLIRQSQDIKANFLVYARGTTGKRAYRNLFLEQLKSIKSVQLGSINKQNVSSQTSAEYNPIDFVHTNCSIVLETVFDRIHLTEKILRPIACGHPFIILNGAGALETIRSYGFRTFQPYIDESYDREQSPAKRMEMVISEMHRINNASAKYQKYIWDGCKEIAQYNKRLFFDDKFIWRVKTELRQTVRSV